MATRCFRTHLCIPAVATTRNTDACVNYAKDYAISIATIHHLATAERRVAGVKVRFVEYHWQNLSNKQ